MMDLPKLEVPKDVITSRSGVAGLYLAFLWGNGEATTSVIVAGLVCAVAYMILDGIKHAKAKK